MPSPVGHLIAGATVAWAADVVDPDPARAAARSGSVWTRAGGGLVAVCAVLGALPDIDLLTGGHRTITHSIGATIVVGVVAAIVAAATGRRVWRTTLVCALAYGSHLVLDWMAVDVWGPRGIRALWPFSDAWFISGWDVFLQTERRQLLSFGTLMINLRAVAREIEVLLPIAAVVFCLRRLRLIPIKAATRFATELPGGDHATQ